MNDKELKQLLERKTSEFNQPTIIETDPISIPHRFSKKQDKEISGFFAAIFAWGNRTTIKQKARELMALMDDAPHEFVLHHEESDLKKLLHFKHRTFNATDLLYFIEFFRFHYSKHRSLEEAFTKHMKVGDKTIENGLAGFYEYFFSLEHVPYRTRKHVASPERGTTCKRINMFLRCMVRKDDNGVDFGIWKKISPAQLISPIDLHVARVARDLKLIERKQIDWLAAVQLTERLRAFDAIDPVKYDFALFGLSSLNPFLKKVKDGRKTH